MVYNVKLKKREANGIYFLSLAKRIDYSQVIDCVGLVETFLVCLVGWLVWFGLVCSASLVGLERSGRGREIYFVS